MKTASCVIKEKATGAEVRCATPDKCRIQATGPSMSTLMYYEPIYDGHGNNLNPDMNTHYHPRKCATCGQESPT